MRRTVLRAFHGASWIFLPMSLRHQSFIKAAQSEMGNPLAMRTPEVPFPDVQPLPKIPGCNDGTEDECTRNRAVQMDKLTAGADLVSSMRKTQWDQLERLNNVDVPRIVTAVRNAQARLPVADNKVTRQAAAVAQLNQNRLLFIDSEEKFKLQWRIWLDDNILNIRKYASKSDAADQMLKDGRKITTEAGILYALIDQLDALDKAVMDVFQSNLKKMLDNLNLMLTLFVKGRNQQLKNAADTLVSQDQTRLAYEADMDKTLSDFMSSLVAANNSLSNLNSLRNQLDNQLATDGANRADAGTSALDQSTDQKSSQLLSSVGNMIKTFLDRSLMLIDNTFKNYTIERNRINDEVDSVVNDTTTKLDHDKTVIYANIDDVRKAIKLKEMDQKDQITRFTNTISNATDQLTMDLTHLNTEYETGRANLDQTISDVENLIIQYGGNLEQKATELLKKLNDQVTALSQSAHAAVNDFIVKTANVSEAMTATVLLAQAQAGMLQATGEFTVSRALSDSLTGINELSSAGAVSDPNVDAIKRSQNDNVEAIKEAANALAETVSQHMLEIQSAASGGQADAKAAAVKARGKLMTVVNDYGNAIKGVMSSAAGQNLAVQMGVQNAIGDGNAAASNVGNALSTAVRSQRTLSRNHFKLDGTQRQVLGGISGEVSTAASAGQRSVQLLSNQATQEAKSALNAAAQDAANNLLNLIDQQRSLLEKSRFSSLDDQSQIDDEFKTSSAAIDKAAQALVLLAQGVRQVFADRDNELQTLNNTLEDLMSRSLSEVNFRRDQLVKNLDSQRMQLSNDANTKAMASVEDLKKRLYDDGSSLNDTIDKIAKSLSMNEGDVANFVSKMKSRIAAANSTRDEEKRNFEKLKQDADSGHSNVLQMIQDFKNKLYGASNQTLDELDGMTLKFENLALNIPKSLETQNAQAHDTYSASQNEIESKINDIKGSSLNATSAGEKMMIAKSEAIVTTMKGLVDEINNNSAVIKQKISLGDRNAYLDYLNTAKKTMKLMEAVDLMAQSVSASSTEKNQEFGSISSKSASLLEKAANTVSAVQKQLAIEQQQRESSQSMETEMVGMRAQLGLKNAENKIKSAVEIATASTSGLLNEVLKQKNNVTKTYQMITEGHDSVKNAISAVLDRISEVENNVMQGSTVSEADITTQLAMTRQAVSGCLDAWQSYTELMRSKFAKFHTSDEDFVFDAQSVLNRALINGADKLESSLSAVDDARGSVAKSWKVASFFDNDMRNRTLHLNTMEKIYNQTFSNLHDYLMSKLPNAAISANTEFQIARAEFKNNMTQFLADVKELVDENIQKLTTLA